MTGSYPSMNSVIFFFNVLAALIFPTLGNIIGFSVTSGEAFGIFAGTAVNDTSSVVAAGYAFSEIAGDFATMVKLTRTLSIIPTVIVFALIGVRVKRKEAALAGKTSDAKANVKFTKLFPWFILGFVALAMINSTGYVPAAVSHGAKDISKFLMVTALGAIGLNTSFKDMKKSGIRPMIHGFIISILVVIVAIVVEYFIGFDAITAVGSGVM